MMSTTGQCDHARPESRPSAWLNATLRLAKNRTYFLIAAAALLGQGGCGYSLAGRGSFLPAYIHRIGIPQFTNQTAVFAFTIFKSGVT